MKKAAVLTLMILILSVSSLFAVRENNPGHEAKLDAFYVKIAVEFGFPAGDIKAVREKGYSAFFSFILLQIAKESGKPVDEIINSREKLGYSWQDMCEAYGIDYPEFMERVKSEVAAKKITFPLPTGKEYRSSIAAMPRQEDAKK